MNDLWAAAGRVDRIVLREHEVLAEIGAFGPERGRRQRLRFSIAVDVAPAQAGDDVDRILSYDRLVEAVAAALAEERLNLLETLAERIAARILAEPRALRVALSVEKRDLGPYVLGVEIARDRSDLALAADAAGVAPVPRVVLVPAALARDPAFPARVTAWLDGRAPLLVVPGWPEAPRPQAADPRAQRRIDLLALEQVAWALAAADPRCLVVASRTELDWALRRGRPVLWAPGKIVLDAPDAPVTADPAALAAWIAARLGATGVDHAPVAAPAEGRARRPAG